ncbi:MAG: type 1 glutamine amidotransferase [Deltaproteobacteria bacterium]|nr:type 1 glutamine amidotransferase [Deltaproteobacteria bacterium]MBW2075751.1 type 1 glutamine amidotransferase [Deltaproteobacteria bacterium]
MTKRFLVFQHMPWEGPGQHLIRSVRNQGVRLDILEVWHQPISEITSYDGLIVLGGGPNVDQEKEYPFLKAEKEAIRQVIDEDMPYVGFCLGHQLLAEALGARVGPNFCRSVGFIAGHVTKDGRRHPMFYGMPSPFPLFKWHAQAVLPPLPKEVEVLATSAECQVEAISIQGRPHVVGFQFDNQAGTVADVRMWMKGDQKWLSQLPGVDTSAIVKEAQRYEASIGEQFEFMFRNYIKLIS